MAGMELASDSSGAYGDGYFAKVKAVFNKLDLDQNGIIDREELGTVLRANDAEYWSDARLDGLLESMNAKGDGAIHLGEMQTWLSDKPQHRLWKVLTDTPMISMTGVENGAPPVSINWSSGGQSRDNDELPSLTELRAKQALRRAENERNDLYSQMHERVFKDGTRPGSPSRPKSLDSAARETLEELRARSAEFDRPASSDSAVRETLAEIRARSADKFAELDRQNESIRMNQVAEVTALRVKYDAKFEDMVRTNARLEAENKELYLMMKSQTQAIELLGIRCSRLEGEVREGRGSDATGMLSRDKGTLMTAGPLLSGTPLPLNNFFRTGDAGAVYSGAVENQASRSPSPSTQGFVQEKLSRGHGTPEMKAPEAFFLPEMKATEAFFNSSPQPGNLLSTVSAPDTFYTAAQTMSYQSAPSATGSSLSAIDAVCKEDIFKTFPENSGGMPAALREAIMEKQLKAPAVAAACVDTTGDGLANYVVVGEDKNFDGIPDMLQSGMPQRRQVLSHLPLPSAGASLVVSPSTAGATRTVFPAGVRPVGASVTSTAAFERAFSPTGDARANHFVFGPDRSYDGIPDVLQQSRGSAIWTPQLTPRPRGLRRSHDITPPHRQVILQSPRQGTPLRGRNFQQATGSPGPSRGRTPTGRSLITSASAFHSAVPLVGVPQGRGGKIQSVSVVPTPGMTPSVSLPGSTQLTPGALSGSASAFGGSVRAPINTLTTGPSLPQVGIVDYNTIVVEDVAKGLMRGVC